MDNINEVVEGLTGNIKIEHTITGNITLSGGGGGGNLQDEKIVNLVTAIPLEIVPDEGYDGMKKAVVQRISLYNKNATPIFRDKSYAAADEGKIGYSAFTVKSANNMFTATTLSDETFRQMKYIQECTFPNATLINGGAFALSQNLKAVHFGKFCALDGSGSLVFPQGFEKIYVKSADLSTYQNDANWTDQLSLCAVMGINITFVAE